MEHAGMPRPPGTGLPDYRFPGADADNPVSRHLHRVHVDVG
jgi:hypothetical protein